MDPPQHLDDTLENWPYDPTAVSVRVVEGGDKRDVIQMRVELGVLQLETTGRPDGWRPEGEDTYAWYRLENDPREQRDLSEANEGAATALRAKMAQLAAENIARRIEGRRVPLEELDEKTIEQLRGLGYLD